MESILHSSSSTIPKFVIPDCFSLKRSHCPAFLNVSSPSSSSPSSWSLCNVHGSPVGATRKSVAVGAKKSDEHEKRESDDGYLIGPDETTGLFPEAVLLKEVASSFLLVFCSLFFFLLERRASRFSMFLESGSFASSWELHPFRFSGILVARNWYGTERFSRTFGVCGLFPGAVLLKEVALRFFSFSFSRRASRILMFWNLGLLSLVGNFILSIFREFLLEENGMEQSESEERLVYVGLVYGVIVTATFCVLEMIASTFL